MGCTQELSRSGREQAEELIDLRRQLQRRRRQLRRIDRAAARLTIALRKVDPDQGNQEWDHNESDTDVRAADGGQCQSIRFAFSQRR